MSPIARLLVAGMAELPALGTRVAAKAEAVSAPVRKNENEGPAQAWAGQVSGRLYFNSDSSNGYQLETSGVVLIRSRMPPPELQVVPRVWQVLMVTAEAAASVRGVTRRTVYRWVESGRVHFVETPGGLLLLCLNSLINSRIKTKEGAS